ncbi:AraC family transcriptional regulator [Sandaracinus amylolyticus]|uniref:AraC family transcriptional regulator n=1 Tax=Sandaracinus amylolyticus TaxID=927083 RepID=UPI001F4184A9|nr:AraC family transcriptional regulator [Sandaracinus amylolyticus]UJR86997.1 Hypothetical protein I5071_90980 [Sandaracinus amylolyticus]
MTLARPQIAFVPARYYDALVAFLAERGIERTTLLARTGIDLERLRDEDGFLSIDEVERLVLRAARLTRDESLALELGRRFHLPSHGAVGTAGLTAPDVDAAIRIAQRYFRLVAPLFVLDYTIEAHVARITLRPAWAIHARAERFHVETILGSLFAQGMFLIGGHVPALEHAGRVEVDLPYARPGELPRWVAAVRPKIFYRRPSHELRVPRSVIDVRSPLADARAHARACRACDELLAALPVPDRIATAVRHHLEHAGPPFPDLESVSRALGASSRTLRRRLVDEGTSFRDVLDDVRIGLARKWLAQGDRSITTIGIDLGYSDAANFTRAFRRVCGVSPTAFQRGAQPR